MTAAIHPAMPRTTTRVHDFAHGIKGPAISAPTPRIEVPRTQAVTSDVMQAPYRETVISNAGAVFRAMQAMRASGTYAQAI